MLLSHGTEAFCSFTTPFMMSEMFGMVPVAPIPTLPVASSVSISESILRLTVLTVVICIIARWFPCEAKMLKPVLRTRSCHSASVQVFCVFASARAVMRPLIPRVVAVALPEPATRKMA